MEKKVYEIRSGSAMLTEKEFKKFQKGDTINGTYKSSVAISYDTIEEAKQMLKRLKCTYERNNANGLYFVSEYGFIDEDDCGTCDIYLAEEENGVEKEV